MKQLLFLCIALYLSFNGYGQKKSPSPPQTEAAKEKPASDTRLRNTHWNLTIDTSGNTKTLILRKLRNGDQAVYLIHFINKKEFVMTVNIPGCSFKATGTYILNFIDAGTKDVIQLGTSNLLSFNRQGKLPPCAEQIKDQISGGYFTGSYDEAEFMLETERPAIGIQ